MSEVKKYVIQTYLLIICRIFGVLTSRVSEEPVSIIMLQLLEIHLFQFLGNKSKLN